MGLGGMKGANLVYQVKVYKSRDPNRLYFQGKSRRDKPVYKEYRKQLWVNRKKVPLRICNYKLNHLGLQSEFYLCDPTTLSE